MPLIVRRNRYLAIRKRSVRCLVAARPRWVVEADVNVAAEASAALLQVVAPPAFLGQERLELSDRADVALDCRSKPCEPTRPRPDRTSASSTMDESELMDGDVDRPRHAIPPSTTRTGSRSSGKSPVIRRFPMVLGIDLAGVVETVQPFAASRPATR